MLIVSSRVVLKYIYGNKKTKAKLTFNKITYLQRCDWLRIDKAMPMAVSNQLDLIIVVILKLSQDVS